MTNHVCARITIYLLVAVAVLTLAPSVSFADSNPTVLPPPMVYGRTYAEWSVLWWQYFLPLTKTQFDNCTIGRAPHANVAFLFGKPGPPSGCAGTVSSNTSLFFPIGNVDCSSLEAPPFNGTSPAARDSCAFNFFFSSSFPLSTGTVVFDGQFALPLLPTYPTKSPDFAFTVGSDNVFGINCTSGSCKGQATGYGYYLMLAPLQAGTTHSIRIIAPDYGIDTTWNLIVQ